MADHIQIGDIAPRIHYTGDGVTVAFTYPFPIFQDADIAVYLDGSLQTPATHFTVTNAGQSSGGTVTFVTPPGNGVAVALVRELTIQRLSDFQAAGEFRANVINDEMDFQIAVLQQLADEIERSIRLEVSDSPSALTLPNSAGRAGRVLAFDGGGDVKTLRPNAEAHITMTAFAESLLENADASAARTALGLGDAATGGFGTEIQAFDNDLAAIAALTPTSGQALVYNGSTWTAGAIDNADDIARDMAASALAYMLAQNDAASLTGSVGKFNLSDDFEADSLTTATNATYDASGDYYVGQTASETLSTPETDTWTVPAGVTSLSVQLWGSGGGGGGGRSAGSGWYGGSGGGGGGYTSSTLSVTPGQEVSYTVGAGGGGGGQSTNGSNGNASVFGALSAGGGSGGAGQTDIIAYFVFEPQVSLTFGTDIVGKISIDGGSTWATGTWTKVDDIGSAGEEIYRLEADVSGQSGSSLVYEITTINNKEVRLHDSVGLIAIY